MLAAATLKRDLNLSLDDVARITQFQRNCANQSKLSEKSNTKCKNDAPSWAQQRHNSANAMLHSLKLGRNPMIETQTPHYAVIMPQHARIH